MKATTRLVAAAMCGLGLLGSASGVSAQSRAPEVSGRLGSFAGGSIEGIVRDEKGAPVAGAMVSAIGATTAFALSDPAGHFELATLAPGSYLLRAHLTGFAAPRGQIIEVHANLRATSAIALSRVPASYPILEAGLGVPIATTGETANADPAPAAATPAATAGDDDSTPADDHSEMAWRLRHARRGVLKDVTFPGELLIGDDGRSDFRFLGANGVLADTARLATNFFADTPFSGQFNLLTTGSFDTPQQLFTTDSFSRSVADVSLGAPAGSHADWLVRGALTQGEVSSWIVAGAYTTRAPSRHQYDLGLSYSTQRYTAGNPGAFHEIDGSRNAGVVYAGDTFAISPSVVVNYGARYSRYDYLAHGNLLSPHVGLELVPADHLRIKALVSQRSVAPGAEEFVAPTDGGPWQPTQRTFSPLSGGPLESERTRHAEMDVERDFGRSTILVRAFTQKVDDQLVTVFGATMPGRPVSSLAHYFVGGDGSAEANGWATGFRTVLAERVRASVEYTQTRARWTPNTDLSYLIIVAPSSAGADRTSIHDVATTVETDVPETSTKVLVLYRVGDGFAHAASDPSATERTFDSRFDVQVRQSLPFMDFTSAKWEMLVAVKNFFRDSAADQSVYDELLVVRPPKRIVGGLTLHF